jgi:DNA-binding NarL/FixJ family response regulator
LSKPFHPGELEAIIYNLVDQKKNKLAWILNNYLKLKKIRFLFLEKTYKYSTLKINISAIEKTILKKILNKQTNEEIAKDLNVTKRNIEKHISRLLNKTNIRNKAELYQLH